MSVTRGILKGKKVSNSHSTFTKDAEIIIKAAKEEEAVKKIVLGEIVPVKGGRRRLKFVRIPAGYRVTVRGFSCQQILFIYTHDETLPGRLGRQFGV